VTLNNINVEETVQQVANLLATEQGLSPALKGSLEMLLLLVSLLLNRLGLNSSNSSKPPSTDPFRKKQPRPASDRKPGGQPGHVGSPCSRWPIPISSGRSRWTAVSYPRANTGWSVTRGGRYRSGHHHGGDRMASRDPR
jgi:hypothetical protein